MTERNTGGKNPKKKEKKGQLTPAQKKLLDTKQISDKRAREVFKGKMTWNEARKQQRAQDSTTMVTRTKVATKVSGSSQGLPSKSKYTKSRFKRGNDGNIKPY